MRLLIAVPSYGEWAPDFGQSLALLMANLVGHEDIESVRLSRCDATIIAAGRADLVKDALKHKATSILWLDTDMKFRPENVRQLLSRDTDIVACTYPKRRPPYDMTAQTVDGERIKPGDGDLIEASHVGFGIALTRVSVFEKMSEPWFAFPWLEDAGVFMGEDVFFSHKARANGFKVYVDPVASKGIGHVGRHVFEAD